MDAYVKLPNRLSCRLCDQLIHRKLYHTLWCNSVICDECEQIANNAINEYKNKNINK